MFKVTVLYPSSDGSTFDMEYYRDKHMPLAGRVLGAERYEIDNCVDGPFMAMGHFFYPTRAELDAGMSGPEAGQALADVPNYTNIQPQILISEVVE
jgi:uncharacterized protein (TIGR02118 family)